MCRFNIGNFVNKFVWVICTPMIWNARPLLYSFTIVLKGAHRDCFTKFWWPTNRRHYIRLYLKLPIPRFNNIIPCASGRYQWSNMNFNNSAARGVPPWSWPKSYNSRSKSGDWVPTFDPPIPSNGDWPKICVTVFVSIRDLFHLAGLHMKPPTVRSGSCL